MKKVLPVFLALIFVFMPFLNNGAFAYTGGLLNGLPAYRSTSHTATPNSTVYTSATDNNESLGVSLFNSSSSSNLDTLVIPLSSPVTVDSFKLKASDNLSSYNLYLMDSNNSVLYSGSTTVIDGTKTNLNGNQVISNVSKVAITNVSSSNSPTIYEFDVFGPVDTTPPAEVTALSETHTDSEVDFSWSAPLDADFDKVEIYRNSSLLATVPKGTNTYQDLTVTSSTTYNYLFKTVDTTGNASSGVPLVVTTSSVADTTPPGVIGNLAETHTDTTVDLSWTNPTDPDLDKIKIMQNGSIIYNGSVVTSYNITGLAPSTAYAFSVVAVDTSGNTSNAITINVTTDSALDTNPPAVPVGLTVNSGNAYLYASWSPNAESDLAGYNVYVNGVKYNNNLLVNPSVSIQNLTNGTSYDLQVSAVDTSGNESNLSGVISGSPTSTAMPLLSIGYDLFDVANGIESWFSDLWLVLAFAVGIPLSFYIASRLKLMFIG